MIIQKPCKWGEYFKIIIQRPDYQNPITKKTPPENSGSARGRMMGLEPTTLGTTIRCSTS